MGELYQCYSPECQAELLVFFRFLPVFWDFGRCTSVRRWPILWSVLATTTRYCGVNADDAETPLGAAVKGYSVDFTENVAGVFLATINNKAPKAIPPIKIIILTLFKRVIITFINSLLVKTVILYILEVMLL